MSFIDLGKDLDDVKEPETVPEGQYDLTIEAADAKEENGSLKGVSIRLGIEGHPDAATVFHYLSMPMEGDDEDKVNFKLRFVKKFFAAFNIETENGGFELADLPGQSGKCKLILDEYNGMINNKIKL